MKADILMKITKRFRQEMFKQMKNCVSESIRAITRKIPNTDKWGFISCLQSSMLSVQFKEPFIFFELVYQFIIESGI